MLAVVSFSILREGRNESPSHGEIRRFADIRCADSFRRFGFWDVTKAPFTPEIVSDPIVWVPSITSAAVFFTMKLLEAQDFVPVRSSGKTYIGKTELHPAMWWSLVTMGSVSSISMNSTGEQALFRGVLYEEFKTASSPVATRVFDMVFCPSSIWRTIIVDYGIRALPTQAFDCAYDKGGLPYSSAVHFRSNELPEIGRYLFTGGGPAR